jgi:hypothetical protein
MGPKLCALRFCAAATAGPRPTVRLHVWFRLAAAFCAFATIACSAEVSLADEGGVGFWFPGLFGSLSAVPQVPGWALGIVNLYNPVSGGGNVAAARQVTINNLPVSANVNLNATIKANPNLVLVAQPTLLLRKTVRRRRS